MESLRFLGTWLMVLLFVSAPPGCKSKSSSARIYVKVSGKVVDAQGKPIPTLNIRFLPTENVESFRVDKYTLEYPLAIGNKDGTFALSMKGGDIEGARPGKYRVMVTGFSRAANEKIPPRYRDPDSPLEVTIPDHDVSDLILKIE
jgi:hypothetical protein